MNRGGCAYFVIYQLPLLSASLYVEHHFEENADSVTRDVSKLVKEIETSFVDMIREEVEWMDDETKEKAIEKAEAIEAKIGYPKELLSTNDLYPGLSIDPNKFFENIMRARKYDIESYRVSRCNI